MKKSKTLTFFLSFVPGVGHYYLEHMQRGLQFNLIFFGLIFTFVAKIKCPVPCPWVIALLIP